MVVTARRPAIEVLPPIVHRRVLYVEEAARALGVSPATVRRRIKDGLIRTVSYTDRTLISLDEIERLTKAGRR